MSINLDNLKNFFKYFNLTEESVKIYIFVLQNTYVSPLEVSRNLKIPRTKVYRCLNKLVELKLIKLVVGEKGAIRFSSDKPENVLNLVHIKEKELLLLKSGMTGLVNQLNQIVQNNTKDFEIISTNIFQNYIQKLRNSEVTLVLLNKNGEYLTKLIHKSNSVRMINNLIKNKKHVPVNTNSSQSNMMITSDGVFLIHEFEVLKIENAFIRELLLNNFQTKL